MSGFVKGILDRDDSDSDNDTEVIGEHLQYICLYIVI
jgi:hypothetical protein